jgi:hypothetical protein
LRSGKKIDNQDVNPNDLPKISFKSLMPLNEPNLNIESNSESHLLPTQVDQPTEFQVAFPHLLRPEKHCDQMERVLEIFKQVKVNIHLLDIIQQIPDPC